ncbi:MAG: methionyl-tRNA formyltransferase [Niastella sp.]|nr:methionyl-tRNA formyltransferase [Niastella sp.]
MPYALEIVQELQNKKHDATLINEAAGVMKGDVLFLLSCEKIFTQFHLNKHNLVAHASDLPKGRGWSPLSWQIMEGKNEIPVTLFEAVEKVDAGKIYYQSVIRYDGTELIDELRFKLAKAIEGLLLNFVSAYPNVTGTEQSGEPTYFKKRKPGDSMLDINKSLADQFNLLRINDNERYPSYFEKDGVKYILKIYKD